MQSNGPHPPSWDDFYNTTPAWYNGGVTSLILLNAQDRALQMNNVIGWLSASLKVKDTDSSQGTMLVSDDMFNCDSKACLL